jgi:hypothetical protein
MMIFTLLDKRRSAACGLRLDRQHADRRTAPAKPLAAVCVGEHPAEYLPGAVCPFTRVTSDRAASGRARMGPRRADGSHPSNSLVR